MDATLASQVAAGEVIERPASVIKELIENSVDAGARKIEIEIQRGGAAMMRVRDDGCGMAAADAALALERHATSKLKTSEDLEGILTLGFRGEALPSIASVSRFTMQTRETGAGEGTEVRVEGGQLTPPRSVGCPIGTSIEVRDLFYNVPARKKFLRAETTEAAHIDHQVRVHALSAPGVGWVLRKDGRVALNLPATSDRRVRIEALTGVESGRDLVTVPPWEGRGVSVEGAVLPASYARRGRKHQYVFLNGRPVEDGAISRALREGFKGALADGHHPAAWLWLTIDPALVDVNVHPAKREVRFRDPAPIRLAIMEALESALRPKPVSRPVESPTSQWTPSVIETQPELPRESALPSQSPSAPDEPPSSADSSEREHPPTPVAEVKIPDFRLIGDLSHEYVLMEGDEGLVLLHPQGAHERVIYEKLLAGQENLESQGLLVPILLELDARDADFLMRHREHFDDAGFSLETFGGRTVQVSAIPTFLQLDDARRFLNELVDGLLDHEGTGRVRRLAYEGFAARVASAGSRQAEWKLAGIPSLLKDLFVCDLPYCDPAGRPTLVQISSQELARKFGRT